MIQPTVESLRINETRLVNRIARLASLGTTRVAFSEADCRGRELIIEMMKEVGLDTSIDSASNIIGRREGRQKRPKILVGSHVDTVRNGGRFDGVLGCVAAIEVVHTLEEENVETEHPLEIMIFANEEGQAFSGMTGSRAVAGILDPIELTEKDENGRTLAKAIEVCGGDPARLADVERKPSESVGYIELHIEQGGVLEQRGTAIGIVEGIVSLMHAKIVVTGTARHSGTTPMSLRRDALTAAAKFIIIVEDEIRSGKLCSVGTVGQLQVEPNSPNVIPGEVRLTLELRDLDDAKVRSSFEYLRHHAVEIARISGVEIIVDETKQFSSALADPFVVGSILRATARLGLSHHVMPSGAGHDAQMIAKIAPMGMIFVPSVAGISHAVNELTSDGDCVNGANVLLHAILELDANQGKVHRFTQDRE